MLIQSVRSAVSGVVPGVFAYAERWDEGASRYVGLAVEGSSSAPVVIDSDSVIVQPAVAQDHRKRQQTPPQPPKIGDGGNDGGNGPNPPPTPPAPPVEKLPTRFIGTVMISPDRPAHDMRQIVEAIVEQLTTLQGSSVDLKLEIDAEVPSGLDRAKVRTLLENATTLRFIDKAVQ